MASSNEQTSLSSVATTKDAEEFHHEEEESIEERVSDREQKHKAFLAECKKNREEHERFMAEYEENKRYLALVGEFDQYIEDIDRFCLDLYDDPSWTELQPKIAELEDRQEELSFGGGATPERFEVIWKKTTGIAFEDWLDSVLGPALDKLQEYMEMWAKGYFKEYQTFMDGYKESDAYKKCCAEEEEETGAGHTSSVVEENTDDEDDEAKANHGGLVIHCCCRRIVIRVLK